MAGKVQKPAVVYWDTNVFIYLFTNQPPEGYDLSGINYWKDKADKGEVVVVTSSLTFVEVMEGKLTPEQMTLFEKFMRDRVELKDAHVGVMRKAGELREHYYQEWASRRKIKAERRAEKQAQLSGEREKYVSLCGPDAIHLATALIYGCTEFHTYDARRKKECIGLLNLALPAADAGMQITRPTEPPPPPPSAYVPLFTDADFAAQGDLSLPSPPSSGGEPPHANPPQS